MLNVTMEAQATYQAMDQIVRRVFPFALAKSLTLTAKDAQKLVRLASYEKFDLHGEFIPQGVRIKPATKLSYEADVHTAPKISTFIPIQEYGGIKKPEDQKLVIPGKDIWKYGYRSATNRILKKWKPAQLIHSNKKHNRPFTIKNKDGIGMIVQRINSNNYPLHVLYVFVDKSDIKERWRFEKTVESVVRLRFKAKLQQALDDAWGTV